MINALVGFAKFFLVVQVIVGGSLFVGLALILSFTGTVTMWQMLAMAGGGVGLLATAGFAAVLFQISDRLAQLIAQGSTGRQSPATITHTPRREPSLRADRA
ncbi:hypothetical protein [Oceaniovalibus sp. ACAM 378]|uniref:hypothetical protein n=1 Tax=Oceaniovalibus sp. ACAM 378 TaxID=2599923 RepID=UPI0011D4DE36|nr:hypothetical protein [Oceaniovalibus sp. ACAM 378]TYB85842.1 hypothetical protein FQ320_18490 [Oceaniovalibus sp. ACAM 378]